MKETSTRSYRFSTLIAALLVGASFTAHAQDDRLSELEARLETLERQVQAPNALQASWQNGLRLNSADGAVRLQIGGRVQADFAGIDADQSLEDEVGALHSGTRLRRGRLYFSGTLYEHTFFRVEYDFAGGRGSLMDAHIGIRDIPYLGTVRVGRMLEQHSLEQMSGNNFHFFMERGLPAAFNEYWANGIAIQNQFGDQRGSWAVGASKRTNAFGESASNSHHNVSGRITAVPYFDAGQTWVHLAASMVHRKPDGDSYQIGSRPESSVAPALVRTGPIPSDGVNLFGFELGAAHGPLTVIGEYQWARVDLIESEDFPHSGNADLGGFYLAASYFLTGEHRAYNRATGVLGRVVPRSNFRSEGHGLGAWEVAVRYSVLDLNDGPVEGGELRDWTLGVNWYLNPNMRLMWNYVRADLQEVGKADIAQMRVQFDF